MPASILIIISHAGLWCVYTMVLMLSRHDHKLFEMLLLVLFAYFGYLLTDHAISRKNSAFRITLSSTLLYIVGRWAAVNFLHIQI